MDSTRHLHPSDGVGIRSTPNAFGIGFGNSASKNLACLYFVRTDSVGDISVFKIF